MKKQLCLLAFSVFISVAIFAQNTIDGYFYPITTYTATTATLSGERTTGTGPFHVKSQNRVYGTTPFFDGDTVHYPNVGATTFSFLKDSLIPITHYEFRLVYYTNDYADSFVTTTIQDVITPALPGQAIMNYVSTHPFLPASQITFSFTAPGNSPALGWRVYGKAAPNYTSCTDTIIVTTISGTDTLHMQNNQGQIMPTGFIVYEPMTQMPGLHVDQTASWPAFTAPSYAMPKIANLVFVVKYIDSMKMTSIITVGNGGPVDLVTQLCDSNEQILSQWPSQTVTVSGPLSFSKTGLKPGTKYKVKQIGLTPNVGTVTAMDSFYTAPVPKPTATISNQEKTRFTTGFDLNIQTNGTWAESVVDTVGIYENGVLTTYPASISGTGTINLSYMGKTPNTPYSYNGYIKNVFGGIALIPTFTIVTDPPMYAVMPDWGTIWVNSPSRITIQSIAYVVNPGDIGQLQVFVRKDGTVTWDTIVVAGNLTGSGTLDAVITGLLGGTKYFFKIAMKSSDGDIAVNGTNTDHWEVTFSPSDGVVADIILNQLGANSVAGHSIGDANGTLSEVVHEVYRIDNGNPLFDQGNSAQNVGTGEFDISFSFPNLLSNSNFELRSTIRKQDGSNPHAHSKYFTTLISGLTKEITEDEFMAKVLMGVWDMQGRFLVVEPGYLSDLIKVDYHQPVIIAPVDRAFREAHKGKVYCHVD